MKRSATEIIRRGFDNALANWPLMLIRIAEGMLFLIIAVGAVIAVVIPFAVSIGFSKFDLSSADNPAAFVLELLKTHWLILVYIAVLITVLMIVYVALHSFVQAGAARVLADAERAAGPAIVPRDRLRLFSIDRWVSGGRQSWWAVFLIYNIAWTVAGLIILLPLLVILALLLYLSRSPIAPVMGCIAIALTLFFSILVSVVTNVWTQKAIALEAVRRRGASDALSDAWTEAWSDFGRHFAVAFVMLVLMIGGSGLIASMSFATSFPIGGDSFVNLALSPLRLMLSLMSSAFSAAIANWFLASFIALSAESRV